MCAPNSPVVSNDPWLDFSSVEQLNRKIGRGSPNSLYKISEGLSANSRVGIGIAKYPVFGKAADKRIGIAAVPHVMVTPRNLSGIHSIQFLQGGAKRERIGSM
jgi:hypothetical protein